MKLPFVKLHGCANDYVLVDGVEHGAGRDLAAWSALARSACERRLGVGSDGLLVVLPPTSRDSRDSGDARMAMFNPDGSEAEMCGNGLRCLGKFLFDRGRVGRSFRVETRSTVVPMRVDELDAHGRARELSLEIGVPDFAPSHVPFVRSRTASVHSREPTSGDDAPALDEPFLLAGRTLKVSALRLGNPHCVVFVDDVERFPVEGVGSAIERDPRFPQRVNVEFVQKIGPDRLEQRTWERGAGETLACGSGATAAAIVARKVAGFGEQVTVKLRGGELVVRWSGDGRPATLRGPAEQTFVGELEI